MAADLIERLAMWERALDPSDEGWQEVHDALSAFMDIASLASPSGRQPGDTHVSTFMPVGLFDACGQHHAALEDTDG